MAAHLHFTDVLRRCVTLPEPFSTFTFAQMVTLLAPHEALDPATFVDGTEIVVAGTSSRRIPMCAAARLAIGPTSGPFRAVVGAELDDCSFRQRLNEAILEHMPEAGSPEQAHANAVRDVIAAAGTSDALSYAGLTPGPVVDVTTIIDGLAVAAGFDLSSAQ